MIRWNERQGKQPGRARMCPRCTGQAERLHRLASQQLLALVVDGRTPVRLCREIASRLGVPLADLRRAAVGLEKAGFVRVGVDRWTAEALVFLAPDIEAELNE